MLPRMKKGFIFSTMEVVEGDGKSNIGGGKSVSMIVPEVQDVFWCLIASFRTHRFKWRLHLYFSILHLPLFFFIFLPHNHAGVIASALLLDDWFQEKPKSRPFSVAFYSGKKGQLRTLRAVYLVLWYGVFDFLVCWLRTKWDCQTSLSCLNFGRSFTFQFEWDFALFCCRLCFAHGLGLLAV